MTSAKDAAVALILTAFLALSFAIPFAQAEEVEVGQVAPSFVLKNQNGMDFDLNSRKGKGWTVLYFFPKAGSRNCIKQAVVYQDEIGEIREVNAEVYGISADTVEAQAEFHRKEHLTFDLLSDSGLEAIKLYGVQRANSGIAKRWTFIIDPEMRIKAIEKDVDPNNDAEKVAAGLKEFQALQKP